MPQKPDPPKPITRREFAKGSMAVLGAYSSLSQEPPEPLSAEAKALKLEIPDDLKSLLEDRHILEEDIRRVIDNAEKTGLKLYEPGTQNFLSKLRINEAMFYVEYSSGKEGFKVRTAYTHRFKMEGE